MRQEIGVDGACEAVAECFREGRPPGAGEVYSLIWRATPRGGSITATTRAIREAWEAAVVETGLEREFPDLGDQM